MFNVNDIVPIGTVIARLDTNAGNNANPTTIVETASAAPIATPTVIETPIATANVKPVQEVPYVPTAVTAKVAGNNKFYSPLVLNIANSEGIGLSELEYIVGTGADGRVSKRDVCGR